MGWKFSRVQMVIEFPTRAAFLFFFFVVILVIVTLVIVGDAVRSCADMSAGSRMHVTHD